MAQQSQTAPIIPVLYEGAELTGTVRDPAATSFVDTLAGFYFTGSAFIAQTLSLEALTAIGSIEIACTNGDANNYIQAWYQYTTDNYTWSGWVYMGQTSTVDTFSVGLSGLDNFKAYIVNVKILPTAPNGILTTEDISIYVTQVPNLDITMKTRWFNGQTSIFDTFNTGNIQIAQLSANLYQKFYQPGILPSENVISRSGNFPDFWQAMALWFSMMYNFAAGFANMANNPSMFRKYMEQRGLFFNGTESVATLQEMATGYYHTVQMRGTLGVLTEWQNLIGWDNEEFIYLVVHPSWIMGQGSPCYKALDYYISLNRMPEKGYNGLGTLNLSDFVTMQTGGTIGVASTVDNQGNTINVIQMQNAPI